MVSNRIYCGMGPFGLFQQRRDVLEHHSLFRIVGDVGYMALKIVGSHWFPFPGSFLELDLLYLECPLRSFTLPSAAMI